MVFGALLAGAFFGALLAGAFSGALPTLGALGVVLGGIEVRYNTRAKIGVYTVIPNGQKGVTLKPGP